MPLCFAGFSLGVSLQDGELGTDQAAGDSARLFILSDREREGLAAQAARIGWRAVAARREEGAAQRFLSGMAQVALVDVRGETRADACDRIEVLADAVAACGGALVALVDARLAGEAEALIASGATHILRAPHDDAELRLTLLSAGALVARLGGGRLRDRHAILRSDALSWRYDAGGGGFSLSVGLAKRLDWPAERKVRAFDLVRLLPRAERRFAIGMARQVAQTGAPAAFAVESPVLPGQRLVQHLHPDAAGMTGEIELLASAGDTRLPQQRDFLTGLGNRGAALEWIEDRLDRVEAGGGATLILLSIGQFDRVNSAYGQPAGDALLARLGRRIERIATESGNATLIARLTGAEFLVGLDDVAGERPALIARRMMQAARQPFSAGDHLIHLTARCGVASARKGDDPLRFLRRVGAALADARASTGSDVRVRTSDRAGRDIDEDRLEADLRLAIDADEIQIVFQPQYATADDRIVGVEALARWHHPHYGELGAALLFASAERTDFMLPLSAHIQAKALGMAAAWPTELAHLRMAVNVTAADIAQPDFLLRFLTEVDRHGLDRGRITVEITESGLIEDMEAAAALLSRLRGQGLRVAIDDFGTGYSSLAYLKGLPVDYLKIDSGLAKDISGSARDRAIVRGIIDIAKSIDLKVIAEGVENERQLFALARAGCDYYQGFLRSPAVDTDTLVKLVRAASS